jgi:KDO2-lipid IV(A) lauroyltransferase
MTATTSSRPPIRMFHRLEALGAGAVAWVTGRLPLGLLGRFSSLMAVVNFDLLRIRRSTALENLARAFPEKPWAERRRIARASYRHAFLGYGEFARMARGSGDLDASGVVEVRNEGPAAALADQGPVVAVLGHLGNWEYMANYWVGRGKRAAAIYKPLHNPILDERFLRIRADSGAQYISNRLPPRQLWRRLDEAVRGGVSLAFVADQDARRHGVFVPFFGRLASTHTGPATLALRYGLPIVPVFPLRISPGRFRIEVGDPILPPEGGRTAKNVEAMTRRHVEALEAAVRANPEQYFWFHRRWKTRPKSEKRRSR